MWFMPTRDSSSCRLAVATHLMPPTTTRGDWNWAITNKVLAPPLSPSMEGPAMTIWWVVHEPTQLLVGRATITLSAGRETIDLAGDGGRDRLYGNTPTASQFETAYPYVSVRPDGFDEFDFPAEMYVYPLARPFEFQPTGERSGIDLNATDGATLGDAWGVQGSFDGEQLSAAVNIGDMTGEGFDDFVFVGSAHSYIAFGPVDPQGLESIADVAQIVVDHVALGRPATRFGDLNGDGSADLAFVRSEGTQSVITAVFGGISMWPDGWPRSWDAAFVNNVLDAGNSRQVRLNDVQLNPTDVTVEMLNFDGDANTDLLISSHSVQGAATLNVVRDDLKIIPELGSITYDGFTYFAAMFDGPTPHVVPGPQLHRMAPDGSIECLELLNTSEFKFIGTYLSGTPTNYQIHDGELYFTVTNRSYTDSQNDGQGYIYKISGTNAPTRVFRTKPEQGVRLDEIVSFAIVQGEIYFTVSNSVSLYKATSDVAAITVTLDTFDAPFITFDFSRKALVYDLTSFDDKLYFIALEARQREPWQYVPGQPSANGLT